MRWASKRRLIYLGIILIPIILIGLIWFFSSRPEPTCFDGKKNGNEVGIDCGGICEKVCQELALPVAILWTQEVHIIDDVYHVVANMENPNRGLEAYNAPYIFKLYDNKGLLIYERKGRGYIPSNQQFYIFESGLRVGNRTPTRATFEYAQSPYWERAKNKEIKMSASEIVLENKRLEAVLKNKTLDDAKNVKLVAVLFDRDENIVNASQTVIDSLKADE